MKISTFLILFLLAHVTMAQNKVEIIYRGKLLNGPDGMAIDSKGNIFIANWGKDGKGTTITKFSENGKPEAFLDNLKSPDGLAFDKQENLYISNFLSGEIAFTNKNKDTVTLFAKIPGHPAGMTFDSDGNLYVADFGNWDGQTVYKVNPKGEVNVFATGFEAPLGLVFDAAGNLYVSNFSSGKINKVDRQGNKTVFAQMDNVTKNMLQFLIFDKNKNLIVPSYGHNCLYQVNGKGEINKIASFTDYQTGKPYPLHGPNSIAMNSQGEIFITEFNSGSLLKLHLN